MQQNRAANDNESFTLTVPVGGSVFISNDMENTGPVTVAVSGPATAAATFPNDIPSQQAAHLVHQYSRSFSQNASSGSVPGVSGDIGTTTDNDTTVDPIDAVVVDDVDFFNWLVGCISKNNFAAVETWVRSRGTVPGNSDENGHNLLHHLILHEPQLNDDHREQRNKLWFLLIGIKDDSEENPPIQYCMRSMCCYHQDRYGKTPAHYAAIIKKRRLIDAKVNPHSEGYLAFKTPTRNDYRENVLHTRAQVLSNLSSNPTAHARRDNFMIFFLKKESPSTVRRLLLQKNEFENTPLDIARLNDENQSLAEIIECHMIMDACCNRSSGLKMPEEHPRT